jgi:hypothetical protein
MIGSPIPQCGGSSHSTSANASVSLTIGNHQVSVHISAYEIEGEDGTIVQMGEGAYLIAALAADIEDLLFDYAEEVEDGEDGNE